jgi:hypothetical protein
VFGVVLELLIVEEELLACCENKFGAAVNAFQHSISEFHGGLASQGITPKSVTAQLGTCRSRFPVLFLVVQQGPGPRKKVGGSQTTARYSEQRRICTRVACRASILASLVSVRGYGNARVLAVMHHSRESFD